MLEKLNELFRKIYSNFRLDYRLITTSNLKFVERINYTFNKYFCILTNKRKIKYLGKEFAYDNRFAPAILQDYPREIIEIDRAINLKKIRKVLDIGANIGQFSFTLSKFFPNIEVYSFEPNKSAFKFLEKNVKELEKVRVYNYGVGKIEGKRILYYSKSASSEGSLYKKNMNQNYLRKDILKTDIEILKPTKDNLRNLGIPIRIDLVKIDVEGAELEVLESLKEIEFDYLYIEVSVKRKGGTLNEIFDLIREKLEKTPKLLYYCLPEKNSPCANAIFLLKNNEQR